MNKGWKKNIYSNKNIFKFKKIIIWYESCSTSLVIDITKFYYNRIVINMYVLYKMYVLSGTGYGRDCKETGMELRVYHLWRV